MCFIFVSWHPACNKKVLTHTQSTVANRNSSCAVHKAITDLKSMAHKLMSGKLKQMRANKKKSEMKWNLKYDWNTKRTRAKSNPLISHASYFVWVHFYLNYSYSSILTLGFYLICSFVWAMKIFRLLSTTQQYTTSCPSITIMDGSHFFFCAHPLFVSAGIVRCSPLCWKPTSMRFIIGCLPNFLIVNIDSVSFSHSSKNYDVSKYLFTQNMQIKTIESQNMIYS